MITVITKRDGTIMFPVSATRPPSLCSSKRKAPVLKLPRTKLGREALREFHRINNVWSRCEGYRVEDADWDELPDLVHGCDADSEAYAQDYYQWCLSQGQGAPW